MLCQEIYNEIDDHYNEQFSQKQLFDDKKLEFFTYTSSMNVGLEHVSTGNANKIYHGPVPIIITFKDTPERVIQIFFNIINYRKVMINITESI